METEDGPVNLDKYPLQNFTFTISLTTESYPDDIPDGTDLPVSDQVTFEYPFKSLNYGDYSITDLKDFLVPLNLDAEFRIVIVANRDRLYAVEFEPSSLLFKPTVENKLVTFTTKETKRNVIVNFDYRWCMGHYRDQGYKQSVNTKIEFEIDSDTDSIIDRSEYELVDINSNSHFNDIIAGKVTSHWILKNWNPADKLTVFALLNNYDVCYYNPEKPTDLYISKYFENFGSSNYPDVDEDLEIDVPITDICFFKITDSEGNVWNRQLDTSVKDAFTMPITFTNVDGNKVENIIAGYGVDSNTVPSLALRNNIASVNFQYGSVIVPVGISFGDPSLTEFRSGLNIFRYGGFLDNKRSPLDGDGFVTMIWDMEPNKNITTLSYCPLGSWSNYGVITDWSKVYGLEIILSGVSEKYHMSMQELGYLELPPGNYSEIQIIHPYRDQMSTFSLSYDPLQNCGSNASITTTSNGWILKNVTISPQPENISGEDELAIISIHVDMMIITGRI